MSCDVLFVDTYPHYLYGAQRTMLELSLGAARHPLALVTGPGPLPDALEASGVPVTVLEYPPRLQRYRGALLGGSPLSRLAVVGALLRYNLRAAGVIRSSGARVVFCSNTRSVLSVGLGARLLRRPVVWYIQQTETSFGLSDRLACRLATRIISITGRCDRVLPPARRAALGERFGVIALGTEVPAAPPPLREPTGHSLRFGMIALVTPHKGHATAIEALGRVADGQLVMIGAPGSNDDETYQRSLQERATELGITDRIAWRGWADDARTALPEIDVLLCPSRHEGLPRAIMEAMAAGLPVIATDVGGVRDLVEDGVNGYVIEVGDEAGLAAAMSRFLDDRSLCRTMGAAGYERAARHFDRRDFLRAFAAEFERLGSR